MRRKMRSFLYRSLKSQLEASAGKDPILRLDYLVSHIEEYVQRFTGICEATSIGKWVGTGLDGMVKIAIDVINEEYAAISSASPFWEKWADFTQAFEAIGPESPKEMLGELTRKLGEVTLELKSEKERLKNK